MPDIPLWTLDLSQSESRMVLRALLAVVAGMGGESELKAWFRAVVADLQAGLPSIEGCNVDLIALADAVEVHYANEVLNEKTEESRKRAAVANTWANSVYKLIRTMPRKVRKVAEKPKPARQVSLFGDEG